MTHSCKYHQVGGGTDLTSSISDVEYKCECGNRLVMKMKKSEYLDRKYPGVILSVKFESPGN